MFRCFLTSMISGELVFVFMHAFLTSAQVYTEMQVLGVMFGSIMPQNL